MGKPNVLVIVESPNKVKKIQQILNQVDQTHNFSVMATVGHLMDLNKAKGSLGIDLENDYQPDYVILSDKKKVITQLRTGARKADQIWIASDLDQEGEFIGYSICQVLKIKPEATPRLIFNEITQNALKEAINHPTRLDQRILDAQKCRRLTDRLIGFQISAVARKINHAISVGRVKTMMVKAVADRQNEIDLFVHDKFFRLQGDFSLDSLLLEATSNHHLQSQQDVLNYLKLFLDSNQLSITKINDHQVKEAPGEPFMTASLQKIASRYLAISPKMVLSIAQKLYEKGLISYPRTDTTRLPDEKHGQIKTLILNKYGQKYYHARQAKQKTKNSQAAHAAIYPTDLAKDKLAASEASNLEQRLYDLIYQQTVASQMSAAIYRQVEIEFKHPKESLIIWSSKHKTLIFDGYLILQNKPSSVGDQDLDGLLEKLKLGALVTAQKVKVVEDQTKPKPLFDESGLLDQMEKHGIGRPSTWGTILNETIERGFLAYYTKPSQTQERKVIIYQTDEINQFIESYQIAKGKQSLIITELGKAMIDFSQTYFSELFNYQFTGNLETDLKAIEHGEKTWLEVVDHLYRSYQPILNEIISNKQTTDQFKKARNLGLYQGQEVVALIGRYGPVIKIGTQKPTFYPIKAPLTIECVQLSDLGDIIKDKQSNQKSTIKLGKYLIMKGPFGPYLRVGRKTFSIPETYHEQLEQITAAQCAQWSKK